MIEHGVMLMNMLKNILFTLALLTAPAMVGAQASAPVAPVAAPSVAAPAPVVADPAPAAAAPADAAKAKPAASTDGSLPGYTPMIPTKCIGMPTAKEIDFQEQFSENGQYAKSINNNVLLPIIFAISLFVLALLLWIVVRFRRSANPVPSKTTHNTTIEVIWTLVPVLILLGIAYPSLDLLAKQFKPAPANAVTIKATGYQWYWGYTYPDHGGFEVVSNMLKEPGEAPKGERTRTDNDGPELLAVDNRMVVPAGVPLRIQTTGADVIHAFAVPSLWFKLDAVPGRLNEKSLTITKPGVYFGPCSELCGARHGFMPVVVEALPPEKFALWVKAQGGTMPGTKPATSATAPTPAAATPPATPVTQTPAPAAAATK
jgi:cytochrome c oxidase subunit II